ncbi:MAG TPA: hypothetical protein VFH59_07660 [Frateuria sp.]|uniref:hypothetical protein n=1 Tax=Frateuria sp. TaxID=2211372 RepID=UPI002D81161D|nr:hypothetical protein [Frateuria sp.]HET6805297.1 hypothetical protein [Frateuria sp.]
MTMGWTLAGTFTQLMLAGFLFMMVVFSASGIGNGVVLGRLQLAIFNASVFVLPALCVLSAGIVVYLHLHGGGASSYAWYAMPLGAMAVYLVYAVAVARSGPGRFDRPHQPPGWRPEAGARDRRQ